MKRLYKIIISLFVVVVLSGFLVSCESDDESNSNVSDVIGDDDPGQGFLANSTSYRLLLDFEETNEFNVALDPGMIIEMRLSSRQTHLIHIVVLDTRTGRAVSEYVNSFYIDDIPLDNKLHDFVCSWYIEFMSESGFANKFGT